MNKNKEALKNIIMAEFLDYAKNNWDDFQDISHSIKYINKFIDDNF